MDGKPSQKVNPYPGRLIIICDKKGRILYEQMALPAKALADGARDKRDKRGQKHEGHDEGHVS